MQPSFEILMRSVRGSLIPPRSRILVGVSGGPDSVALLEALHAARFEGWELCVAHINHGLRGTESEEDERFVCGLAARHGVHIVVERVDTRIHAQRRRCSIETAARELRHSAFLSILRQWNGDVVALGHTQNDQAETVMLHLLRGAGLTGLAGMRARDRHLVRPFLSVDRGTIVRALEEIHVAYRLDSTNQDPRHRRNQIRGELLPQLSTMQPSIVSILGRTAALVQTDVDFLNVEARRALEHLGICSGEGFASASVPVWLALHPALRRVTLRLLLTDILRIDIDVEQQHLADMERTIGNPSEQGRCATRYPHGLRLEVDRGRFRLTRDARHDIDPTAVVTSIPGECYSAFGVLRADGPFPRNELDIDALISVAGPYHAVCDADSFGSSLTIRSKLEGDRIRPIGLGGTRKIQDIMVDRRVPRRERRRWAVVDNGSHVVWLPGLVLDERVAVSEMTKRVVHLRFTPTHA